MSEEERDDYFVTGATGFIGRFLLDQLLKREGTIYVLCRASSLDKLDELRSRSAPTTTASSRSSATSPRSASASPNEIDALDGKIEHFFHLAAIYDLTADADSQRVANVEGTRHAVQLAEAVHAGHFHQVSSIAAAGLYKGMFTEDMFDEAEDVDHNPYYPTKHESEAVVRDECKVPWRVYRPGIVVGHSETGEIDKIDGPYYFFRASSGCAAPCRRGCAASASRAARSTSSRSTTSRRRWTTSRTSPGWTGRPST